MKSLFKLILVMADASFKAINNKCLHIKPLQF